MTFEDSYRKGLGKIYDSIFNVKKYDDEDEGGLFLGDGRKADKEITSLKGIPETIVGDLYINLPKLKSLKHFPKKVTGNVTIIAPIASLQGLAKTEIGGRLTCENLKALKSVKAVPEKVKGFVSFRGCVNIKDVSPLSKIKKVLVTHPDGSIGQYK